MMHGIFVDGGKTPVIVQPATQPYRPVRGEYSWVVREIPAGVTITSYTDLSQFPIVDSYSPPGMSRPRVITRFEGSWAQSLRGR